MSSSNTAMETLLRPCPRHDSKKDLKIKKKEAKAQQVQGGGIDEVGGTVGMERHAAGHDADHGNRLFQLRLAPTTTTRTRTTTTTTTTTEIGSEEIET